jgi:hypothetical protein
MRLSLAIASAAALLALVSVSASAAPPIDPTRAGLCDDFDGLAFTFCVAICEARTCDLVPDDDQRCAVLRRGFARVSDGRIAPCDASPGEAAERRAL